MRKLFCIFLILFCLSSTAIIAYSDSIKIDGFVPSPTVENLYAVAGPVDIFENSKFDYLSMIKGSFSDKVIECIPLTFWSLNENVRSERFNMTLPNADLWAYDCFIIDADGNILGNAVCKYFECPYCEWWYDVCITMAPGKYLENQVVYLVWVEE